MKKSVIVAIVVIAIVPLYCGATWYSAVLTTERSNQMLASMTDHYKDIVEQYKDVVKVVSRKVDNHFFSATEDITFEINEPLLNNLLKNGSPEKKNTQFVIHNDIAFGPLPNFRSVGLASIETSLVLTEEQKQALIKAVGTDKPLRFVTTMGYFSKTRFNIISVPLEFHASTGDEHGSWKGGQLQFSFSNDLYVSEFNGSAPGLVVTGKDNSVLHMDNLTLNGAVQRKFDILFTGSETFGIGNISFADPSKVNEDFTAKDLVYGLRATADDQFINFGIVASSGAFNYKTVNLKEAHFDFGTNHLDAKALVSICRAIQDAQTKLLKQATSGNMQNPAQDVYDIKKQAQKDFLTILQHSPVLSLDNIGFATRDGTLKITGNATVNDVLEEDISPEVQYQSLAKKIQAQADISIDQGLIDHWPVADNAEQLKQQLSALESQGFIIRKGATLQSHIEYKDGKITANGKQVGG